MSKMTVIVGSHSQDGKFAFDLLSEKGYEVIGIDRGVVKTYGVKWDTVVDIADKNAVSQFLKEVQPDEVYYLAAFHHSS